VLAVHYSATLSTTNSMLTRLGLNPGLRGEGQATDSLSHDPADDACRYRCVLDG